ncbi:MAG: arginine--tRNA ligase [Candidatus Marinimicrobia bacterium]|nr:arginine--tRNA ligase [Candidatus Neomarinimicrobiota bacterium]
MLYLKLMIQDQLQKDFVKALVKLKLPDKKLVFEHPANLEHGDYSTNIALLVKKKEAPTPFDLANLIVNTFRSLGMPEYLGKIQVAPPGFINFWLKNESLGNQLERVLKEKEKYGASNLGKGEPLLLEHTSPDPIKTIHIGHLRNNFLGMAMARILASQGYVVTKDGINNDRGTHVSRAMWGYLVFGQKRVLNKKKMIEFKITDAEIKQAAKGADGQILLDEWSKKPKNWLDPRDLGLKSDHFDLIVYSLGARAEDLVKGVKEQVRTMLQQWEKREKQNRALWRKIINWSLVGYQATYQRIGSEHDYVWHESKLYQAGKDLVKKGLKKGVFRQLPDGAILSDLKDYGLTDAILIKADGTSIYHTFDLNLTLQKRKKFPSKLYLWDIGNDQILYLKQLFAMCEQLGIGKREDYFHLNYGYLTLKGQGKMSSRKGSVVKTDELLDSTHQQALAIIKQSAPALRKVKSQKEKEVLAEQVALAALKYGLLKFSREKDIQFDIEESVKLEGDSGPYLQYTYARCQSVLAKAETPLVLPENWPDLKQEETILLRTVYRYPEILVQAAQLYAPNLVCNFLFDLAQKYNLFYHQLPILQAENEALQRFRLVLTAAVGQVLKNGLALLGIAAPEKM